MQPIYVTEPHFPSEAIFSNYLKGIWERRQLTNGGPLVNELEEKLARYLDLEQPIFALTNGGVALQLALRSLGIGGEIVTTPFSYVATASCPLWDGCTIRFADIDPSSLTLDPAAVEARITPKTEAILATHVFGNPCDIDALEDLASKHGLALIYDAAHAFGVRFRERNILDYGDASILSAHATKLFHTVEGGFVVCRREIPRVRLEWMRRYAHDGEGSFHGIGINGKMSELHAAMGLALLAEIGDVFTARKAICSQYDKALESLAGVNFAFKLREGTTWNQVYYPVLFDSEEDLLRCQGKMNRDRIYPRRYFYPSLNTVDQLIDGEGRFDCPVSESVSRRVLCLPLASNMTPEICDRVISSLTKGLGSV